MRNDYQTNRDRRRRYIRPQTTYGDRVRTINQDDYEEQLAEFERLEAATNYPYSKADALGLLRKKREKNEMDEHMVTEGNAKTQVKLWLKKMIDYGYDFRFINEIIPAKEGDYDKQTQNLHRIKKFRRKVYVGFECKYCQNRYGIVKRWTSILGLFQIRFCFEALDTFLENNPEFNEKKGSKINYPYILKWDLKIYKEQCKKCKGDGSVSIFEEHLKGCLMDFGRIVSNVLAGIKPVRNIDKRHKIIQNHNHHEDLCQACKKGVCFNSSKRQPIQIRPKQEL